MIPIHIPGGLKSIPYSSRPSVYTFIMEVPPTPCKLALYLDKKKPCLIRPKILRELCICPKQKNNCYLYMQILIMNSNINPQQFIPILSRHRIYNASIFTSTLYN